MLESLNAAGAGIEADMVFEGGKMNQISVQRKRRQLIAYFFGCIRRRFFYDRSNDFKLLPNLRRECRDIVIGRSNDCFVLAHPNTTFLAFPLIFT